MPTHHQTTADEPRLRILLSILFGVWLGVFLISVTGYPSLLDNERRVSGYILDAVENGDWLIQRDAMGHVASKPPMLTWLAGLMTLATGRLTLVGIYLPSALAMLGSAWLICLAGRKYFGWLAGFLAALTYLLSPLANCQVTTVRYDGLFTFPVLLGALAAYQAWNTGRGWTWFWLAAALATLTKGPLALILSAAGLLAAIWEWRSGHPLKPRGNHLLGIGLYLLICGGWFGLAYWQMGQPLIDKMIGTELIRHSLGDEDKGLRITFYKPTLDVIGYYLPWSLLAIPALRRVWKQPSLDADTRRFERFLFCWLIAGLLIFSISSHQRGRLIFPLLPIMALMAGREMARLTACWSTEKIWKWTAATAALGLAIFAIYRHYILGFTEDVKDTRTICKLADSIRGNLGEQFPLTHLDSPNALQFYLNTYRPRASQSQAVDLLRGEAAAFVAIEKMDRFRKHPGAADLRLYEFLPHKMCDDDVLRIVSNHPKLEWTGSMAAIFGPLKVQMTGVKLLQQKGNHLVFQRLQSPEPSVSISNLSKESQRVRVRFSDDKNRGLQERQLAPGESWQP